MPGDVRSVVGKVVQILVARILKKGRWWVVVLHLAGRKQIWLPLEGHDFREDIMEHESQVLMPVTCCRSYTNAGRASIIFCCHFPPLHL
jgi:hypothetical protein